MSGFPNSFLSLIRLPALATVLFLTSGCALFSEGGTGTGDAVPARPDPWVPLAGPGTAYGSAPVWPTGPASGASQADGMATLIQEIDHLGRLVETVSRLPAAPGEYRISFERIHGDLQAVRAGLVEALLRPHAAPREWPPIRRDYLE